MKLATLDRPEVRQNASLARLGISPSNFRDERAQAMSVQRQSTSLKAPPVYKPATGNVRATFPVSAPWPAAVQPKSPVQYSGSIRADAMRVDRSLRLKAPQVYSPR